MSERDDERPTVSPRSTTSLRDDHRPDPLDPAAQVPSEIPEGFDRRRFIMRGAVISAAAVLTGCSRSENSGPRAAADSRGGCPAGHPTRPRRSAVCRPERGEERAGPGDDGGRRVLQGWAASLELADEPNQSFPLKLGDKTFNLTLNDIVYDATKGDFHHPNTMTAKLLAGDTVLFEQEYYSVGGGLLVATAHDASPRVVENAAESALEHHLGITCDPVAGYVQIACIERCAFGAIKAWTAYAIASNEVASSHRVSLDETILALAQTAKDMNSKYKETSEAGLALSVTLC